MHASSFRLRVAKHRLIIFPRYLSTFLPVQASYWTGFFKSFGGSDAAPFKRQSPPLPRVGLPSKDLMT